jgi:hypothetical protein
MISSAWNEELLHRDLSRLIAAGVVENIACPSHDESDFRARKCFRDKLTGEIYLYIEG